MRTLAGSEGRDTAGASGRSSKSAHGRLNEQGIMRHWVTLRRSSCDAQLLHIACDPRFPKYIGNWAWKPWC